MLDLKFVRENIDIVNTNILHKNEKSSAGPLVELGQRRLDLIQLVEELKSQRNNASKEIAVMKASGRDATLSIAGMKAVSDKIKAIDEQLRALEDDIEGILMHLPNMLHSSVPVGQSAADNVCVRQCGEPRLGKYKDHIEIAKELNIIDFDRGAKVTGGGFAFFVGRGAKLERSLINFFLERHTLRHGYLELMPPLMANRASMTGTGQLPKMLDDMYHCTEDDLFLIPTAEVPLTNFHHSELLRLEQLPLKYCAYSPCFRREAGSYGKDTRGFLRMHQFNKVELVNFVLPESSYQQLEWLVGEVEALLVELDLPYRVLLLCSGDTSFSSAKTYDLEVWSEGEQQWLECSSCSNFEDFQARRSGIRFRRKGDVKPEFVHTLNGSGLATSRVMVALIEKYYSDGVLHVPLCLQSFCGFDRIERPV